MKKMIVMFLGLLLGFEAFASELGNVYYSKYTNASGVHMPESLWVLTEDEITVFRVHNGSLVTRNYGVTTLHDSSIFMTFKANETVYDCGGKDVVYKESAGGGVQVYITEQLDSLLFDYGPISISLTSATAEQAAIRNLPACLIK